MGRKRTVGKRRTRRTYSKEFKAEAVQMLLDGQGEVVSPVFCRAKKINRPRGAKEY